MGLTQIMIHSYIVCGNHTARHYTWEPCDYRDLILHWCLWWHFLSVINNLWVKLNFLNVWNSKHFIDIHTLWPSIINIPPKCPAAWNDMHIFVLFTSQLHRSAAHIITCSDILWETNTLECLLSVAGVCLSTHVNSMHSCQAFSH